MGSESQHQWPINLRVGGGGKVIPPPSAVRGSYWYEVSAYLSSIALGLLVGDASPFVSNSPVIFALGGTALGLTYVGRFLLQIILLMFTGQFSGWFPPIVHDLFIAIAGTGLFALLVCFICELFMPFRWRRHPFLAFVPLFAVVALLILLVQLNHAVSG